MLNRKRMPVVFTGHGYPMNAITDNPARRGWKKIGEEIGKPKAIVAVTSHWETSGICVRIDDTNPQLFDIVDLPEEIYSVHYEPPGAPEYIRRVFELLHGAAYADNTWGIDHALWTTLSNMYPEADVPVVVVSTDIDASPEDMVNTGRKLSPLRDEGVLLFATGNIAHNVDMVDHRMPGGFDWAVEFDRTVKELVLARRLDELMHYQNLKNYQLNMPTVDHYSPLLLILGATSPEDKVTVFNEYTELGSLSMTSYMFGEGLTNFTGRFPSMPR